MKSIVICVASTAVIVLCLFAYSTVSAETMTMATVLYDVRSNGMDSNKCMEWCHQRYKTSADYKNAGKYVVGPCVKQLYEISVPISEAQTTNARCICNCGFCWEK
jgi:hypothetical protein